MPRSGSSSRLLCTRSAALCMLIRSRHRSVWLQPAAQPTATVARPTLEQRRCRPRRQGRTSSLQCFGTRSIRIDRVSVCVTGWRADGRLLHAGTLANAAAFKPGPLHRPSEMRQEGFLGAQSLTHTLAKAAWLLSLVRAPFRGSAAAVLGSFIRAVEDRHGLFKGRSDARDVCKGRWGYMCRWGKECLWRRGATATCTLGNDAVVLFFVAGGGDGLGTGPAQSTIFLGWWRRRHDRLDIAQRGRSGATGWYWRCVAVRRLRWQRASWDCSAVRRASIGWRRPASARWQVVLHRHLPLLDRHLLRRHVLLRRRHLLLLHRPRVLLLHLRRRLGVRKLLRWWRSDERRRASARRKDRWALRLTARARGDISRDRATWRRRPSTGGDVRSVQRAVRRSWRRRYRRRRTRACVRRSRRRELALRRWHRW